jgi:hypothetical protein
VIRLMNFYKSKSVQSVGKSLFQKLKQLHTLLRSSSDKAALQTGQRAGCKIRMPSSTSVQVEPSSSHSLMHSAPKRWPHPVAVSHGSSRQISHPSDRLRRFTSICPLRRQLCAVTSSWVFLSNSLSHRLCPSRRLTRSLRPNISLTLLASALCRASHSV